MQKNENTAALVEWGSRAKCVAVDHTGTLRSHAIVLNVFKEMNKTKRRIIKSFTLDEIWLENVFISERQPLPYKSIL